MNENFQINRTIQERILEILVNEGITPYKFCKDLGFSQGYLDKRGAIGTDKYLKIIKYLPEYNPMWILNEEGSKYNIYEDSESSGLENSLWEEIASDRKYTIEMQKDKLKNLLEEIEKLKKAKENRSNYGMVAKSQPELKPKRSQ